jgi:hypothetical protein
MKKLFIIISSISGTILGVYAAHDREDALDALSRDVGGAVRAAPARDCDVALDEIRDLRDRAAVAHRGAADGPTCAYGPSFLERGAAALTSDLRALAGRPAVEIVDRLGAGTSDWRQCWRVDYAALVLRLVRSDLARRSARDEVGAISLGLQHGAEAACEYLRGENGDAPDVAEMRSTISSGHVGWDEPARNAHAARLAGVREYEDSYYAGYEHAARAAVENAIAEAERLEEDGRALTDDERAAIRANARGEYVFCGDDDSAEQIARGACDDTDWSDDARVEAIQIARAAWDASRAETAAA